MYVTIYMYSIAPRPPLRRITLVARPWALGTCAGRSSARIARAASGRRTLRRGTPIHQSPRLGSARVARWDEGVETWGCEEARAVGPAFGSASGPSLARLWTGGTGCLALGLGGGRGTCACRSGDGDGRRPSRAVAADGVLLHLRGITPARAPASIETGQPYVCICIYVCISIYLSIYIYI